MAKKPKATMRLVLSNHDGLGPIIVGTEAFFEFSFWLAEELEDLVACRAQGFSPEATRAFHRGLGAFDE